ncbi:hypothetical protein H7X46_17300 [Pseudonocardia sp. C8]|uniref:hypothetical protein n=1 Tax=Pseudonocardia sp. C8 TaxID=2762759 RepID=UPI0016425021|nr:hypothetical protein [Pseudonocardia sp. C8]MBC3192824.1 hypothetical protein [Pseudonocardia sp. C8]
MANGMQQQAGGTTAGIARSPAEFTAEELVATSVRVHKPSWMRGRTRFPVSMEEYRELVTAAEQPDPTPLSADTDDTLVEDPSTEVATEPVYDVLDFADVPEDAAPADHAGSLAPATTHSFEGTPQTGFRPPDCTMAVGPADVLVAVNVDLAGYRKDGSLRFRWPNMTALFSTVLPAGAGLFDPKLAYDHYAGRWIIAVAARRQSPAGSWIMLGVSQGADPAGAWWVWALDFGVDGSTPSANWADYPMLGFDTQGIYLTTNQFAVGGSGGFSYAKLRILNKAEAYAGAALGWYDFWNLRNPDNSVAFTVQSTMHFRGTGGNPPAYFCNALWPSGSTLTLWQLDDPLAHWRGAQPNLRAHRVACRSYDLPPDAEQPDTTTRIETNDTRLLSSVFQFVGGTQRLWTAHTSKITWSGDSAARCAVQWYEIDTTTRQVVQQGAFGASGFYYFFPVVQTDISRNAHLCFSRSSRQEYGSLRQTGRRVTDAANSMQGSALVKAGESAYTLGRWGDYFGHARDGGDASRVWLYGEFADAVNSWGTWICGTRF